MTVDPKSLLRAPVVCPKCRWKGPVMACEPDNKGELHCPNCTSLLLVTFENGVIETRLKD
jgi:hypothetical protein